ncbi:ATP-binding protein [Burkholderia singularis]|uniref:histidine kinase n=1 Tax=Burkholderia singularis TaxID=1503053 RepID=A0A238HAC6_9BURK|nr:HAMP domain-containing sensor histidine kinase [Burkholderia singularis]SMG02336.1 Integral membrane sensor signal transduction histidine kinase, glucose catabolism cluster [Burkholderia singularis]
MKPSAGWHWPRTLFARLAVILFAGLALAQALSFWLTWMERDRATVDLMTGYVEREVVSSVALLDRLPQAERSRWLPRLSRRSYQFILGPGENGVPIDASLSERFAQAITDGVGRTYAVKVNAIPGGRERFQAHLTLTDGTPLTIDFRPMSGVPLSNWLPLVLVAQLAMLAGCCWFAVRLATRPLHELARAADGLGPDLKGARMSEAGPSEVARAARAFNAMQERIAAYTAERVQILAAVSHDLQTPITRMRLRVDVMDDSDEAAKLRQDLFEMENLVREGVTYARTLHGVAEAPCRIDLDALLDSLVCDYVDAGHDVSLTKRVTTPIVVRPQALRRVIGNLIDNALKFSSAATLEATLLADGSVAIDVLDRGPGIPAELLDKVFEPFYRIETSRNRGTGGTGLGLAISRQLAQAIDATLVLRNRPGGGLSALLTLNGAQRAPVRPQAERRAGDF